MNAISGAIELRVHGETVKLELTIPAAPVSTTAMLPVWQGMTNTLVAHAARQAESGGKAVTCKEGCWACCRHLIPVSEEETHYLADIVAALPEPRRAELRRRFADTIEVLREAGLLEPLRDRGQGGDRSLHVLGMAFFELNIACHFLRARGALSTRSGRSPAGRIWSRPRRRIVIGRQRSQFKNSRYRPAFSAR